MKSTSGKKVKQTPILRQLSFPFYWKQIYFIEERFRLWIISSRFLQVSLSLIYDVYNMTTNSIFCKKWMLSILASRLIVDLWFVQHDNLLKCFHRLFVTSQLAVKTWIYILRNKILSKPQPLKIQGKEDCIENVCGSGVFPRLKSLLNLLYVSPP